MSTDTELLADFRPGGRYVVADLPRLEAGWVRCCWCSDWTRHEAVCVTCRVLAAFAWVPGIGRLLDARRPR